jgi:DsbC/DsbD-like thiol-disulfide interchange protein
MTRDWSKIPGRLEARSRRALHLTARIGLGGLMLALAPAALMAPALHPSLHWAPAMAASPVSTPGEASAGTAWIDETQVRVRVVDAGPGEGGTHRLGFQIDLTDGWKTYWRHPGETGVGPQFDWSRSFNVAGVTPKFPAPKRFIDGGAVSFGYKTDVILPLEITLKNPGPALVNLDVTYAVCADICLPLQASFELSLNATPDLRSKFLVDRAWNAVPAKTAPAELDGGATIETLDKNAVKVSVPIAGADPSKIDVFAEGPEGWHMPPLEPVSQNADMKVFQLDLSGIPADARDQGEDLRLTVVHPAGAFEQMVPLP